MDEKRNLWKRIWAFVVRAVRENGDVNERRNTQLAKEWSYGPHRP